MDKMKELMQELKILAENNEVLDVREPEAAAALVLADMGELEQEEMWIVLLSTRNEKIGIDKLYKGSLNANLIRIGEIFKEAIRQNAAAIIVFHNHPSGNPAPSPEDVSVTREIVDAGNLLDIYVLDHIIIGKGTFRSLRAAGLGHRWQT